MLDLFKMTDRLVVVTGGAQGIGLAMTEAFVASGARVVIADINYAKAKEAAGSLRAVGATVYALPLDVRDPIGVKAAAEEVEREYGPVHTLVANAGIVQNETAINTSQADWQAVIDVNLTGVFNCATAFGASLLARRIGSVVVTASMSGMIVNVPQAQAAYNASKAGAAHLARSLAVEWAPQGVRVNAVAPGYIATELTLRGRDNPIWAKRWLEGTPLGRLGEPSEVAACALFLASDAASFVTGSVLVVDGGYTAL